MAAASWLDKAVGWVNPAAGAKRAQARAAMDMMRLYDGGRISRMTQGWLTSATSANAEIRYALQMLRDRSRDLVRNNPHGAKAAAVFVNNLVATGIVARSKTGDEVLDDRVNELWASVSGSLDADGQMNFLGMQRLVAGTWFESGEALVRKVIRRNGDARGLTLPLQYRILEPDFIDSRKDGETTDGGRAVQGVQLNAAGDRVAYWLYPAHPGDAARGQQQDSSQVDADQILHVYEKTRPGQVRGVPRLASSMMKMRALDDYEEAELMRKKLEACIVGIVFSDDEDQTGLGPLVRDSAGNTQEKFEPGMIAYSRGGKDVKFTNPAAVPGYEGSMRAMLHSIAAGNLTPYELLTGDLSQVNFSSIRVGLLDFRQMIRSLQGSVMVPMFLEPIWRAFADMAVAAGKLPRRDGGYPVEWVPPRFEQIDPLKESTAALIDVRAGMEPLAKKQVERGNDPAATVAEIERMNAALDEAGIVLDSDPRRVARTGSAHANAPDPNAEDSPAQPAG